MQILYEDKDIIVCEKPRGIASQAERGFEQDMVSLLMNYECQKGNKQPYIGVVHRLDKMVGGIMVYAKNKKAAAELSEQIAGHEMKKKYYAVACGSLMPEQGSMTDYLVRDGKNNRSKIAQPGMKDAKKAELHYQVLEKKIVQCPDGRDATYSLVEVELLTGRHHQIRVQFSSRGFPLYGDKKYNQDSLYQTEGIGLYSYYLEISHPVSHERMVFSKKPENGIFPIFSVIAE